MVPIDWFLTNPSYLSAMSCPKAEEGPPATGYHSNETLAVRRVGLRVRAAEACDGLAQAWETRSFPFPAGSGTEPVEMLNQNTEAGA